MDLSSFLKYLSFEKRYSPNTIAAYRRDLTQFSDFITTTYGEFNLTEVSHLFIRSWMVNLIEQDISPRSINRKLSSLKTYFKFCRKQGLIEKDPTLKIVSPKTGKALPSFVEEKEMFNLLSKLEFGEDFRGYRDRLIIELLYATGIRLSELIGLKDGDVDKPSSQIRVLGKGNKERVIPVGESILDLVDKYKILRDGEFSSTDDRLIVTDKGKEVYRKFIYRKVKKCLTFVSTLDKRSPHVLRHTFATHLVNKGAELNAVKALLGHSSLAATQVYTHNSIDQLKEIYKKAHPKAEE